nr:MAG TPA: hypothetical protein [Siphoviridae sp. ctEci12]
MDAELRFAQEKENRHQRLLYAEYKKDIKALKVTPLLLPYDVQQETCKELDKALEFKPDGWDVYLQMYTEHLPLKGIRSKFEVCGLDEKGNRYPLYQSDYFEMPRGFSHPELQDTWYSFKWYPQGVHAGGIVKMDKLFIENNPGSMWSERDVLREDGYHIFVPNVPESEQAS